MLKCSFSTDRLSVPVEELPLRVDVQPVVRRNSIARQLSCLKRPTHHESVVNQRFIAKVNLPGMILVVYPAAEGIELPSAGQVDLSAYQPASFSSNSSTGIIHGEPRLRPHS